MKLLTFDRSVIYTLPIAERNEAASNKLNSKMIDDPVDFNQILTESLRTETNLQQQLALEQASENT